MECTHAKTYSVLNTNRRRLDAANKLEALVTTGAKVDNVSNFNLYEGSTHSGKGNLH